jgi:predicted flap endonuclease-1-like 5' DNA nuclease
MATLLPFPERSRPNLGGAVVLAGRSLLKVATMADLMRIRGIGVQWAELLEATGIGVAELRREAPETIAERMARVNDTRKIARRVPSAALVRRWAEEARNLG